MNYINEINEIHFETSGKCNLLCPQCGRNNSDGTKKSNLIEQNINGDLIIEKFNEIELNLKHIYFCGNYGDPAMTDETIKLIEYFKNRNCPSFAVFSNMSLRKPEWWYNLGKLLNGYVVMSVDGLEDTNSIYRIGSNWDKIIENVTAFIKSNGRIRWDFLVFDHNKHQIEDVKILANKLGIEKVNFKYTKRFYLMNDPNVIVKEDKNANHELKNIENFQEYLKTSPIICKTKKKNSIYIDSKNRLRPCCWISGFEYETDNSRYYKFMKYILDNYDLSLEKNTINTILNNEFYKNDLYNLWNDLEKRKTCAKFCGDKKCLMI